MAEQSKHTPGPWRLGTRVNYNDGNWWGWNGGECPVHPETLVEVALEGRSGGHGDLRAIADEWDWSRDDDVHAVVAFRVIKEHREPSDFWIGYNWIAYASLEAAHGSFGTASGKPIHVREVLE